MELDEQKSAARKRAFATRKSAVGDAATKAANAALIDVVKSFGARCLSAYWPIRTELDPRSSLTELHDLGFEICLPVVIGAGVPLLFRRWTPDCEMEEGAFGAAIPKTDVETTPELVIAPLLAFDRQGFRLGYGGGFYDRTLAKLAAAGPVKAIGLAYGAQEIDQVPVGPYDRRLDGFVTEGGWISARV